MRSLYDCFQQVFKGPEASDAAKFPTPAIFPTPLFARYFRIVPENFIGMKVLRTELYGCSSEEQPRFGKLKASGSFFKCLLFSILR